MVGARNRFVESVGYEAHEHFRHGIPFNINPALSVVLVSPPAAGRFVDFWLQGVHRVIHGSY
jgi:hypothetical protein